MKSTVKKDKVKESVPKKKVISKENEEIFFEDDDEYEFEV